MTRGAGNPIRRGLLRSEVANPEEERALQLPSGVPVTRNIRTAYAGDQPVEVMDTKSHGEVVMHRFEIEL
jgi:DNA-binding GntR family transcriptional regulator